MGAAVGLRGLLTMDASILVGLSARKEDFPHNAFLLGLFTVCESFTIGVAWVRGRGGEGSHTVGALINLKLWGEGNLEVRRNPTIISTRPKLRSCPTNLT